MSLNSRAPSVSTPDPKSPKSLVTELIAEDESYLHPSNTNGIIIPHCPMQQLQQHFQQLQQPLLLSPPHRRYRDRSESVSNVGQPLANCCNDDGMCCHGNPPSSSPSTLLAAGTLHRSKRCQNSTALNDDGISRMTPRTQRRPPAVSSCSSSAAVGYHRATSCIEENKYTHIWEMPLPIPGE